MTGIVGAVVEAWDELRIHRVRVLLALIGVAVAVTAITAVTAAVTMLSQAMAEQSERWMGRDTTLSAWSTGMSGGLQDAAEIDAVVDEVAERYDISYHTIETWASLSVQGPASSGLDVTVVDPDYGTILRRQVDDGRWFTDQDTERLAPVLVVNQPFLDAYAGGASVASRPVVTLQGATSVVTSVVGRVPVEYSEEGPRAYVLFDHVARWFPDAASADSYRFWVPPESATELAGVLTRDLAAAGVPISVEPPYDEAFALDGAAQWVALGVGAFALLLGGLGLVNIALVTVRYRIREIGIRRSFGATGGRVFFGVLMESVVATTVAGVVGVVLAVAFVKWMPVERIFGAALQDELPFPLSAALVGMASAVGIGALAGLVPAVYAVRVRPIDAIRY
ncbi:ABC transporter permease [Isoptericola croceus]|uniref:ABC transporter permease n=1 Tax=Isoptericola croceus TaxID=3031406 RepID=UPI0023F68FDB|nr:ABC transporter permease [Isoptericola croceus]